MKKKFLLGLSILIFSFSLIGCNNINNKDNQEFLTEVKVEETETETTNIEENIEEISSENISPIPLEEINNEEYLFYACLSIYMEEFDKNYNLAGTAIDNNDLNDFNYYLAKIQENIDEIKKLETPDSMINAKKQIINSLMSYKNAAVKLNSAYTEVNYFKYGEFFKEINIAKDYAKNFATYCENFSSYVTYLSSIMENVYYMSNFNLYSMNNLFTDEENRILYVLNHHLTLLPTKVDKAFLFYKDKEHGVAISEIKQTIDTFNSIEISNENLAKFRDELSESLNDFVVYLELYFNGLELDSLDIEFKNSLDISKNAQRLYDSMIYMQYFYEEKGLSIDFSPTSDYTDFSSSYQLQVDENSNVEIIGEEHSIEE